MNQDTIKKILKWTAGVCAILFVISGVIALLLFNIERKTFSAETYKRAFEEQNLYERMPRFLALALSASVTGNGNANPILNILSTDDWEMSIQSLLPPEELKAITDNALDSTFDYLNGKTDSAVISLVPLKSHFTGASGVEAVTQLLRTQPDCTTEQLAQIALSALAGGDLILCNPPAEVMNLITPMIGTQLQFMMPAFPDQITIISGEKSKTPEDPRIKLNWVRLSMKLTLIFPLLFLTAVTILAVRSLNEWLSWWGWSFFMTGGISLFIALLGAPVIGFIIRGIMQNRVSDFVPPILISAMQEAVSEVARQVLKPVAIEGLILLLTGFGMAITAIYFGKKRKI